MKKVLCSLLFLLLCQISSNATEFNFNLQGNYLANQALSDYTKNSLGDLNSDAIAYFYDMDGDGVQEIIGIVKSNLFYSSEGYKLIVLRKNNDSWSLVNSDIYFDLTEKFEIDKNKVTYYKTSLNKSKKCNSVISNKLSDGFKPANLQKNIKDAQKYYFVTEGTSGVELDISSIDVPVQRAVNISYKNLTDRTKHYLEMK